MSRQLYSRSHLDTTPPKYNGPLHPLDKAVFQKSIPVLAARVPASQIALILHSEVTRKYVSDSCHLSIILKDSCQISHRFAESEAGSELLQAILPEELREGAPVGFAATGHIGMFMREQYQIAM
ncbi:hypothetical protein HHX47_DHR1001033 [Lentinula edodes]|nr:hypothetical protein HHX47_DHR1001033 [Lentinula edodes]